jgi:hypothetical protein
MSVELIPGYVRVVTKSGDYVVISGDVGIRGGSAAISGIAINVQASSGLNVTVQSGVNIVGTLTASVSGQPVALVSGTQVGLSGLQVIVNSGLQVVLQSGTIVVTTTSVSGQPVALVSGTQVGLSGLQVIVQSGLQTILQSGTIVVLASGSAVIVSTSGQPEALVSGTQVGLSGLYTNAYPVPAAAVRARLSQKFSDVSGGQILLSAGVTSVSLRSLDGDVWVGGAQGIDYPYSGYGMLMSIGDSLGLDVANPNLISVCATISGQRVAYIGEQ